MTLSAMLATTAQMTTMKTKSNSDNDSLGNVCDNCPNDDNENQANADGDSLGDVCDNCPNDNNEDQANADGDSFRQCL